LLDGEGIEGLVIGSDPVFFLLVSGFRDFHPLI